MAARPAAKSWLAGQWEVEMKEGPPWTFTTSGYFFVGSKSRGYSNQPCTSYSPFFQVRLLAWPQAGERLLLREVTGATAAGTPARVTTSGGCAKDWKTPATVLPSVE